MSTRIGGRAEADFTSNHRGAEVAFGEVVFSRNPSILSPMIEALSVNPKEVLKTSDSEMKGGRLDGDEDLRFGFGRLLIKLSLADGLVSEAHCGGQ